jgi:hypothetical protein
LMFVFAPLCLLWSRASTIETLAVASSLAAVLLALQWDRGGPNSLLLASCLFAGIAALVKLPTAAVWLAPAGLLLSRHRPLGLVVPITAATIGLLWTAFTDGIKGSIPATSSLTSAALHDWLFGTITQRLDPETWFVVAIWATALFGLVILLRPAVVRESRLGRWSAATMVLGPVVFTNVYVIHDYYWMAVAPAAAILSGLVAASVLNTSSRNLRWLRMVAVIGSLAVAFLVYPRAARMFENVDESDTLRLAAQIRSDTLPTDLVAIRGRAWSPGLLYYADRRGFMEWDGALVAPPGYVLFECPSEAELGSCHRIGVTTGSQ